MIYDSWLLHAYFLCNLGLIVVALGNYIYQEKKLKSGECEGE